MKSYKEAYYSCLHKLYYTMPYLVRKLPAPLSFCNGDCYLFFILLLHHPSYFNSVYSIMSLFYATLLDDPRPPTR